VRRTYEAMPEPKLVVAIGDCGCSGGILEKTTRAAAAVSNVIRSMSPCRAAPRTRWRSCAGFLTAVLHQLKDGNSLSARRSSAASRSPDSPCNSSSPCRPAPKASGDLDGVFLVPAMDDAVVGDNPFHFAVLGIVARGHLDALARGGNIAGFFSRYANLLLRRSAPAISACAASLAFGSLHAGSATARPETRSGRAPRRSASRCAFFCPSAGSLT